VQRLRSGHSGEKLRRCVRQVLDLGPIDRLNDRISRREIAVGRGNADVGTPRYFLEAYVRSHLSKGDLRC
jgi:hypothetical protein